MELKKAGSMTKKKFKVEHFADKVITNIFWDSRDVVLIKYLERGQTVTADRYSANLTSLHETMRRKRISMFKYCVGLPV